MFRKRQKKTFPPGTFIPTPARVCAIIQLCLVFTVILWNLSQPFAGELFKIKSALVLYQDVMGISTRQDLSTEKQTRLVHNADLFTALPKEEREQIIRGMQETQSKLQQSFLAKTARAFHILALEIPPFELAWIILSLTTAIMLLKRVEGASQAVWLLPLLAALYAFDSRWNGTPPDEGDAPLFPSEKILVEDFLKQPLSDNIFEQQSQLQQAWQIYLVEVWAHQTPSHDPAVLALQSEQGEHAFNVVRLKYRTQHAPTAYKPGATPHEPLWLLALYIFWNIYFAYTAWKWIRSAKTVFS